MPALAKTAAATAMALALVGGGSAAVNQPVTALADHATYVTMVAVESAGPGPQVIQGTVACDPPWHLRAWEAFSGRSSCSYDGYAYAFPKGQVAPWEGEIVDLVDTYHVDDTGGTWHVAKIVYRTPGSVDDPDGGLVQAMAAEIMPSAKDLGGKAINYALPVDTDHLGSEVAELEVEIGPTPPPSGSTLPDEPTGGATTTAAGGTAAGTTKAI